MNAPGTHSALTNSALRQERGAASPPALPIATRPSRPAKPPPPPSTPEVRVDTADRLQGAECRVTVILHPLSGRHDATAFHLRPGGCASWHPVTGAPASSSPPRHRRAARRLPGVRAGPPGVRAKFPEGREANQSLLDHLRQCRVKAAVAARVQSEAGACHRTAGSAVRASAASVILSTWRSHIRPSRHQRSRVKSPW